ncbi:MAG: hypothetical protein ACYCOU_02350 [Sulfobacillus sp.]
MILSLIDRAPLLREFKELVGTYAETETCDSGSEETPELVDIGPEGTPTPIGRDFRTPYPESGSGSGSVSGSDPESQVSGRGTFDQQNLGAAEILDQDTQLTQSDQEASRRSDASGRRLQLELQRLPKEPEDCPRCDLRRRILELAQQLFV